ncbi:MAG: UPF0149 family protein [Xanthomonadales bacterium]|nr:UPF0149 family protein [Xanthomonadales bacterium]
MSERPDYSQLDDLLKRNDSGMNAAELHGSLCAHFAVARSPAVAQWLHDAFGVEVETEFLDQETRTALGELFEWTGDALADPQLSFRLYLPDDNEPLERRTRALAGWSTGFLGVLGTAGAQNLERLPGEAGEFVRDLTEIARADFDIDDPDEIEENAFFELVEYARVGTLIVLEAFRGPDEDDSLH